MDKDLILFIVELVVVVGSFLIGRYVLPRAKTSIQNAVAEFGVLLSYAESFCSYARQFLTGYSGSEKMDAVVEKLKAICEKQGIDVDEETLRAIGQKAYDAMKAGENSSKVIIADAVEQLKDASETTTEVFITGLNVDANEAKIESSTTSITTTLENNDVAESVDALKDYVAIEGTLSDEPDTIAESESAKVIANEDSTVETNIE